MHDRTAWVADGDDDAFRTQQDEQLMDGPEPSAAAVTAAISTDDGSATGPTADDVAQASGTSGAVTAGDATEGSDVTAGNPAVPAAATRGGTTHAASATLPHHGIAVRGAGALSSTAADPLDYAVPPRRNGRRRSGGGGRRRPPTRSSIPSARDLLYVLFKHRIKAAVVAVTIFTLAFLAALVLPSKYTSEAQLLVRLGRESLPNSTVAGGPQMMPIVDSAAMVNSEAQILRSREIVAETVRRLGADRIMSNAPAAPNRGARLEQTAAPATTPANAVNAVNDLTPAEALAARLLAERIEVHTEPLSTIIKVDYESTDPQLSHDVVQTYVDSYLDHRSQIYAGGRTGNLFTGLTADTEQKLREIEEQIRSLKDQTGVSDVATQKTILLNRIATLQGNLDNVNAQLAATTSRIATLQTQLAATEREIPLSHTTNEPMGVVATAKNDLNKLQSDLDEKLTRYLPTSPVIIQLREQIASAEKRLHEMEQTTEGQLIGLNPTWSELDKKLADEKTNKEGLDAQARSLNAELERARQGQAQINEVELRMAQLARAQGMADEELKKVAEGQNFSTIDQAMSRDRVGNVTTSQSATLPVKPSSPNRKLMLVFGLFAAMVGGAGTALVSELMDQTVGRPEDLKRLGFTRIVSIPMLRMNNGSASNDNDPNQSDESLVGPFSPETQAIVDLTEHDAANAPTTAIDRMRPTRYVRSTSRAANLRVIGGVPSEQHLSPRELLQRMRNAPTEEAAKAQPASVATISAPKTESPLVLNPPTSRPTLTPRFMEACHALLERLVYSPVATGEFPMPRSIAIVGITPSQGVSTLAAHLAAALADHLPNGEIEQTDPGRVLLVDANLAAPTLHRTLDLQNEPGISEWIKQPTDEPALGEHVRSASIPKLDVLTAGSASVGHTPGRWAEAATMTLESDYHCIVFDLPSMAHAEATARVAGACDAALLVVEGGKVNREVVRQATHRLAESGVRLLGVVLNKRTYPIPEKLYRWI